MLGSCFNLWLAHLLISCLLSLSSLKRAVLPKVAKWKREKNRADILEVQLSIANQKLNRQKARVQEMARVLRLPMETFFLFQLYMRTGNYAIQPTKKDHIDNYKIVQNAVTI